VVRVVLRGGFRGHGVVITIDGHEIYRRSRVTTDAVTLRADAIDVVLSSPLAHVEVSVTPGQLVASVDIAFCDHACLAIDLVGAATVSFETQGGGVPDGAPGTRRARSEAMSHRHPRSEARPSRSEAIDDAVIRRLR
jgi:hypothetical protein